MSIVKDYRSMDGFHRFRFRFIQTEDCIAIYCLSHPSLGGRDASPVYTHLFSSGRLCFVSGQEPRDQRRAEVLAKQWAEYFLEYRRSGIPQR